jgi:hypothetical protein
MEFSAAANAAFSPGGSDSDSQLTDSPPAFAHAAVNGGSIGGAGVDAYASYGVSVMADARANPGGDRVGDADGNAQSVLKFKATFPQLFLEFYTIFTPGAVIETSLFDETLGNYLFNFNASTIPDHFQQNINLSLGNVYTLSFHGSVEVMADSISGPEYDNAESSFYLVTISAVPLPPTFCLLGSCLLGCFIFRGKIL